MAHRILSSSIITSTALETDGKTEAVALTIARTSAPLGVIRWEVPWRQYAFTPATHARYTSAVLKDIQRRMRTMMRRWERENVEKTIAAWSAARLPQAH